MSRRRWVRLALLAVALVVAVVVVRLVGKVDWAEVRSALAHLDWWQAPVLFVVLVARQVLNALPLSLYIPGVSPLRATQNDQVAILMSTVAPPPSDIALRMAMFSSWGVPVAKSMAGTIMNTLTFYIVRFGAPAVGFPPAVAGLVVWRVFTIGGPLALGAISLAAWRRAVPAVTAEPF